MTSDVLVLHYIQLVVKIFYGVVEKIASKLSVSEFVCMFVCLSVCEFPVLLTALRMIGQRLIGRMGTSRMPPLIQIY